jgi:hypothetical protein
MAVTQTRALNPEQDEVLLKKQKKQMKKTLLSIAAIAFNAIAMNAQVNAVDPSTFNGHYFTEAKMVIEKGAYSKKKVDELDIIFDVEKGKLIGTAKGFEDKSDKLIFYTEASQKAWAAKSKIWIFASENMNDSYYGKEMFNRSELTHAVFIEEGVLVIFKYYGAKDKKIKAFDVLTDDINIRIIAKDKSKLSMNKQEAAKKADDLINAAGGAQMIKQLENQKKADFAFPKETLSKTDKQLKADIKEFFDNLGMPADDQSDYVCSYSTNNDWTIITHKVTGAILERQMSIEMVRKGRVSGKCFRFMYLITEQYNGSGYGKPMFVKNWGRVECECADADKNK